MLRARFALKGIEMPAGQAVLLWFLGSGVACILLLAWASVIGLGAQRYRYLAISLFTLTAALAILPVGLGMLRRRADFPFGTVLFLGATLSLAASIAILWRLRRGEGLQRSCDFAIAACLNLWLALGVALSQFPWL